MFSGQFKNVCQIRDSLMVNLDEPDISYVYMMFVKIIQMHFMLSKIFLNLKVDGEKNLPQVSDFTFSEIELSCPKYCLSKAT